MPYESDKQRKYLHAKKPEVAARFDRDIKKKAPKKGAQRRGKK